MNLEPTHNNKERYNALIKDGEIEIIDTFADLPVLRITETELNKKSAVTLCLLLNAYWSEIASARK